MSLKFMIALTSIALATPLAAAMGKDLPEDKSSKEKTYSEKEIRDSVKGSERARGSSETDTRRVGGPTGSTRDKGPKKD